MKPICVPCQRFFRCKKTGFYFIEQMPKIGDALPGTAAPEDWQPYKLWSGDLFECEDCGSKIVVGCGANPIREQHNEDFSKVAADLGAHQLHVNDC